jgi:hypothetical protein
MGRVIDSYIIQAVPYLRQLVVGFPLWSPRVSARVTYVASVVTKVALLVPSVLHTHLTSRVHTIGPLVAAV